MQYYTRQRPSGNLVENLQFHWITKYNDTITTLRIYSHYIDSVGLYLVTVVVWAKCWRRHAKMHSLAMIKWRCFPYLASYVSMSTFVIHPKTQSTSGADGNNTNFRFLVINCWTKLIFDLMVALEQKLGDHQSRLNPLQTINICTIFQGNWSNSCWDVSVWTTVVD